MSDPDNFDLFKKNKLTFFREQKFIECKDTHLSSDISSQGGFPDGRQQRVGPVAVIPGCVTLTCAHIGALCYV